MKNIFKKTLIISLALLMMLSMLASCSKTQNEVIETTKAKEQTEAPKPDSELEIKVYALNGTTALGMSKMINDATANTDSMNYNISLHASADTVTGPIISGECAIAALPTNVAVKLFNKSEGKVQLLALNTLGVLYLIQGEGESVTSLEQLRGKTVYVPGAGANPEYITAALLTKAGLKVGEDVTIDATSYPNPDALVAAVANGSAKLAVLPEPKVTVTTTKNASIKVALDLTQEWEKQFGANTLVQGCLVVNTEFAKAHPAEIAQFLKDYEASVNYIKEGSSEAINMIVNAKILPSEAVATKALPKCNICYIAGEDMKTVMNTFCQAIYSYDANSIAKMPTDAFYYVSEAK